MCVRGKANRAIKSDIRIQIDILFLGHMHLKDYLGLEQASTITLMEIDGRTLQSFPVKMKLTGSALIRSNHLEQQKRQDQNWHVKAHDLMT